MARGILRLHLTRKQFCDNKYSFTTRHYSSTSRPRKYTVLEKAGNKNFSTSSHLRKDAKTTSEVQGIPYQNLTIGVPKEIWKNERR